MAAFVAAVPAQELDSLENIMQNKNQQPGETLDQESKSYAPVIVDENGDEVKIRLGEKEVVRVVEADDSTYVVVGANKIFELTEQPDSTSIRVGDKVITIVENDGNSTIHYNHMNDSWPAKSGRFRGHWAGFEWGINNFLDDDMTLSREGDEQFMDLNTDRSWNINLNFAQFSMGFGSKYVGLVTGLGFEFNNYFFDGNNSIVEQDDYAVADTLDPSNLAKSKLTTSYLRVPLLIEVQFPRTVRSKRVHISTGIVVGLKLGSHTKVMYKDDNGKDKDKNNDDFNISPFRYGLTTRIGFGSMSIFGDYYFTPMFIADKGPSLHPFSVGLSFSF
jgi:hypothetical protein